MTLPLRLALLVGLMGTASTTNAGPTYSGTWERGGDAEKPGGRLLTKHDGDNVAFQLEVWRGAPSHNSGFLAGELRLVGGAGVFRSAEGAGRCELEFRFTETAVVLDYVHNATECQFGQAVSAKGTYKRKSRSRPTFSSADPRRQ